jgi:hypothetical protein
MEEQPPSVVPPATNDMNKKVEERIEALRRLRVDHFGMKIQVTENGIRTRIVIPKDKLERYKQSLSQ